MASPGRLQGCRNDQSAVGTPTRDCVVASCTRAVLGDEVVETLRTGKSLAISLRKAGTLGEAMNLTQEIYARCLKRYGPHRKRRHVRSKPRPRADTGEPDARCIGGKALPLQPA